MGKSVMCSLLFLVVGCTTLSSPASGVALEDIPRQAAALDGHAVSVVGILSEGIGGYFLYANRSSAQGEVYSGGIDVVLKEGAQTPDIGQSGWRCVEVLGIFTAFHEDKLGIGYFRSSSGYVEAAQIRPSAACTAD